MLLDRVSPLLTANPRFYVQTTHAARGGFGVDHAYLEFLTSPRVHVAGDLAPDREGLRVPVRRRRPGGRAHGRGGLQPRGRHAPKSISILVYDLKGELIVDKQPCAALPTADHRTLMIRDLLDDVGYRGDFLGHAEIFYCMDVDPYHDMPHHQVLYLQRGHVEGIQVAAGLWNSPPGWEPRGARDIQGLGVLPICAPTYVDERHTTHLGLTNCSHAWKYGVEALVTISLKTGDRVVDRTEITISPHGTWFDSVTALFPDAERRLRPHGGQGLVVIRPENVRTLGAQFFHVQRATGCFSSEHTL